MKSASDVVLFVMQISIGGQNVAPLEVTKDENSIILAKQFVVKHLLPSDQIMLLSTKIDDIRNQLLAQQENINSNSPKNHQTITTPLNHTKNPLVQISSKILSKSHNIQHSQNEQLQNIRDEFAAFYTKHSQQNDDSQNTKSLRKPFKINVKIQNKRTNRIINEDTTKCEISRKGKSKLIKPIKSMSKAATPRIKKKQNKKRRSSLRSNSVKPRRKDWWNKLHDDANKYHSKIIKEQKIAKATKRRKEIRECTFKPQISEPARTLKRDGSKIWKRIVDPLGENKGSRLRQLRQRKKIKDKEKYKKECTFKPYISDKSQQIMEDKKLDVIIETNDENTGNVFNRLHLSPKSRKLTLHECCSPKKTEREQKRSKSHSLSQQQPRYLLLHELSYKYSKKRGETKFHPDEDITFKPRILNNKHIPVLRKAVINVSDHLYNAHTSSSTQHKVSTSTPKIKRIDTIKVSHETEKLLSKMYKKQANELYFKLCGNIESELLSVPFDRILNETLFNNMNKLESMIIKRIEKFCSRKSKMVLRKNQFVTLFTKLQPKCKNKLLCHV